MTSSVPIPEETATTLTSDSITPPSSAATTSVPDVLITSHQAIRKRPDRDQFSLALDPVSGSSTNASSAATSKTGHPSTSSSSTGAANTNSSSSSSSSATAAAAASSSSKTARRPSSVFEHVNGMLDRFGRRLHSRSEARGEPSRRPSSSVLSLVTPTNLDTAASDSSEAISFEDELSPAGSNFSHTFSSQQDHRQAAANAESTIRSPPPTLSEHLQPSYFYATPGNAIASSSAAMDHSRASSSATPVGANDSDNTLRPAAAATNASASSPASTSMSRRLSVIDRVLIQVTEDNERFSVVDISGLNSAAAVKERMLSKLHLFDEDPESFALSRTEIGAVGSTGPKLDDDQLLAMCWEYGDEKGNLKFLLHQVAPPSTSAHSIMPPPPMHHQLSPRIAMRDVDNNGSSAANTATTPTSFSRQEYSKTPSASSRSSVGEQSAQHYDNAGEGPSEGGPRMYNGTTRAKISPLQRRNNANSQSMVEGSRQYSFSGSDASYTSLNHHGGNTATGALDRMRDSSGGIEEMDDAQDIVDSRYDHIRRPGIRAAPSQSRHSAPGQGQWEMDGSTSSSSASSRTALGAAPNDGGGSSDLRSRPPSYRTTSHPPPLTNKSNSANTAMATSPSSGSSAGSQLPRSLMAGGARDAAQMYTSAQDMYGHVPQARSSVGPPSDQRPDPTQRSHSANMFARRPSTSDARMEIRPFSGSHATNGPPSAGSSTFTPQPASAIGITSPVSPLSRAPDRERSSSFGGSQIYASAHGHPAAAAQPSHQASMHDLRASARPNYQTGVPMPRPFASTHQQAGSQAGQHSHLQPQYGNVPNMRPPFNDRRYMGPAPLPSGVGGGGGGQRPPSALQEFGGRGHAYDPRLNYTNVRPSTPSYDRGRYPSAGMTVGPHQHMHSGNGQVYRDESFMSAHFPASNTRLVSEFQRSASSSHSSLQPGMTVQESLHHHQPYRPSQPQQSQPSSGQHPSHFAGNPNYRPASPYVQHQAPNLNRRSESMTSSLPSGHSNHMSAMIHGPRDARPPSQQQPMQIRPHSLHRPQEHRKEAPPTSVSTPSGGHMPASMEYYYNPATPTAPPSLRVHPSLTSPSMQNRVQDATAVGSSAVPSSATQSPQRIVGQTQAGKASERSSGSSFNTSYSSTHARVPSLGADGRRRESEHSAPTSARSSRTSRSMSPKPEEVEDGNSELPYTTTTTTTELGREGSLKEEDLLKIRPLPRVPAATQMQTIRSSSTANEGSKDEDTFKAEQWKNLMNNVDDDGTARAESKKNKRLADMSAQQIVDGGVPQLDVSLTEPFTHNVDEGEGTFKTFDDEEDEDDEGGTWAQPLDTARQPKVDASTALSNVNAVQRSLSPRPEDGTLKTLLKPLQTPGSPAGTHSQSPRRPVLTLNIEPLQVDSPKLLDEANLANLTLDDVRSSSSSSQGHQASASTSSSNNASVGRSLSFARRERGDWAFRPPPSQLYENLDDFFPKHDLDRPVIDPATGLAPNSPQAGSPRPSSDVAPMTAMKSPSSSSSSPKVSALPRSRMQHQKSIRIVAQDRKRFLERAELAEKRKAGGVAAASTAASGDLARRRSTKLWGGKVIEVTPGTEGASAMAGAESPTSASSSTSDSKPVFKWVKGDLIGKGTYGRVYLALNATTGEMIAVKQVEMPTTDSDREDARQKSVVTALKSEIETLKDLDHPNIVSYLGFEETRTNLSIFLEYVPGGSVGSCLRKHGKLDEATIKSFLQQILNGLNYLHGRGILHRDLKADNLLVDYDGIVKISDFGTVRKSEDIYGNVASMSMQGSIFWMAPEVVSLSRTGYSAKVDIWSLGCVVLEMFAGRRPWSDEEAVQAMFKIGAERRAPPIPPDVRLSKAAAHFLKTCFAVDPNERPTASRLLDHVFPHAEPGWRFAMSDLYRQLHR